MLRHERIVRTYSITPAKSVIMKAIFKKFEYSCNFSCLLLAKCKETADEMMVNEWKEATFRDELPKHHQCQNRFEARSANNKLVTNQTVIWTISISSSILNFMR